MQITSRIHDIPVALSWFPQPYPPNVHLVLDSGEAALIDAGFGDDESIRARLDYITGLGDVHVRYIILTHHHFDHSSGAPRLRDATGAQIVLHRDEAPLLAAADADIPQDAPGDVQRWRKEAAKAIPDLTVDDGAELRVGSVTLRLVHTPGHTAGHISPFLVEERALFAGDNVLGFGTTAISPPPHGDMGLYIQSLRKMQSLDAALLLAGHGPPVREVHRKLQELIDHRQQREEQVLSLLREGRDTPKRMARAIYPELDPRLMGMAVGQVVSHLSKLEKDGRVILHREDGLIVRAELRGEG